MDSANFSANERVDLADLNYAVQETPLQVAREPWAYFGMSPNATSPGYVVSGFKATNPAGNQVQVSLGVALLGRRVGLQVTYGLFTATGDSTQVLDISSYQSGTYGVYIKFDQQLSSYANRTYWQTTSGGSEYAQNSPTRISSTWQMSVTPQSPGPEWLQIASVQMSGCTITDMRPLYFEGRVDQSFASTWGAGTNDRNTDRSTYGVGDLQTFVSAMRTAIEDVKGPGLTRWWENKIGGQNVGFSGTPLLGRTAWTDTNFYAQGDSNAPYLSFAPSSTLTFNRSSAAFLMTVNASQVMLASASLTTFSTPLTVSSKTYPQSIIDSTGATGVGSALKLQAASGTTSVFYAPGGTAALFEQRATNAALSTLATYAGSTLTGTVDASGNRVYGTATSGYAYPTTGSGSSAVTNFAALTLADTSGNTLLRLDTSGKTGVNAIATLRANTATTAVRFTPNANSTTATYSYALTATGTVFALQNGVAQNIWSYDSGVGQFNLLQASPIAYNYFTPATAQTYNPSIYSFVGAGGILLGGSNLQSGGGVVYNPANGSIYWPLQIPDGAVINSIIINCTRSHSGSSTANNNVTIQLVANTGLSNALSGGSVQAANTYAPGWQPNTTAIGSIGQYNIGLSGLNITASGSLYNFLLTFSDTDSNVITTIFKINCTYTRQSVMGAMK